MAYRWPVREVLLTYIAVAKDAAADTFRHAQLLWQVRMMWGGKEKPPSVPPILREIELP